MSTDKKEPTVFRAIAHLNEKLPGQVMDNFGLGRIINDMYTLDKKELETAYHVMKGLVETRRSLGYGPETFQAPKRRAY